MKSVKLLRNFSHRASILRFPVHNIRYCSGSVALTTMSTGGIDEDLLSRQEDPQVIKQKQELLRAFATQLRNHLQKSGNKPLKLKYFLKRGYAK